MGGLKQIKEDIGLLINDMGRGFNKDPFELSRTQIMSRLFGFLYRMDKELEELSESDGTSNDWIIICSTESGDHLYFISDHKILPAEWDQFVVDNYPEEIEGGVNYMRIDDQIEIKTLERI